MRAICAWLFAVFACVALPACATAHTTSEPAAERRVLRAALYPYLPDAGGAYFALEEAFERANPEIDLQITLLGERYYSDNPAHASLLRAVRQQEADVYEIDSVFLDDVRAHLAPLSLDAGATGPLISWAHDLVRLPDGRIIGAPHWVCGNFLFYRASDTAMSRVTSLAGLRRVIGTNPVRRGALLLDGGGTSTLGELYIDALMDRYANPQDAIRRAGVYPPDRDTVASLREALSLNHRGLGLNDAYHDRQGFYARQFARGQGRALVGYSERLYFVLNETMQSCRPDEAGQDECLNASDIRVTDWPAADNSHPIGWTDILGVDNRAPLQTQADGQAFVAFMMKPETYALFLIPAWGEAPRFLLPARDDLYDTLVADFDGRVGDFPAMARAGTLYREMRALIGEATPIHAAGLNDTLRYAARCVRYELEPQGERPAHCAVAAH